MEDIVELLDRLIYTGLIVLVAVSLIVFGASYPYGRAAAVAVAALLLLVFAVRVALAGEFRLMATPLDLSVAIAFAVFLVQMTVGFPWGWSNPPSGEALLAAAAAKPGLLSSFPGTFDYHATRLALVLFLVYCIAFYLTLHSLRNRPQMDRLIGSLVVLVAIVAVYGLFEFLSGNYGILGWKELAVNRVRGTLVNPDHFAATLGMTIPLAIGFLLGSTARRRRRRRHSRSESSQESGVRSEGEPDPSSTPHSSVPSVADSSQSQSAIRNPQSPSPSPVPPGPSSAEPRTSNIEPRTSNSDGDADAVASLFERKRDFRTGEKESRRYLWTLGCVTLIVALFFTMSRAGIIAALAGGAFLVGLLWIREPGYRKRLTTLGLVLAALALIAWIGAEPVLSRFTTVEMDSQSRGLMYRATLQLAKDFPVLGVGLGALDRATPRYSPPEIATTTRINHAHSEPLQLLAEAGIPGILLLLLALFMLFKDVLFRHLFGLGRTFNDAAPQARHDPYNVAIAFGALSAVVTIGFHACLDFPLRIPANGILLAMILAIGVAAAAVRLSPDRAEPLAPVRAVTLSGRGKLLGVLGASAVALFMIWTAVSALLGSEFQDRGQRIVAGAVGSEGRVDRPWIVETSKNKEALEYLGNAVACDPMNSLKHYFLGRLYSQLALRAWNAGLSEEGRFLPDMSARARSALGLLDEAAGQYATALVLAPPLPDAWLDLAWSAGVRGVILAGGPAGAGTDKDYAQLALAGFRQAIALNPNNRHLYDALAAFGLARLGGRNTSLADPIVLEGLQAMQHAVELDPGYLPEALNRILRYTKDDSVLQKVIPAHAPDMLFAAHLMEEQERWQRAKALYRQAIELAPDDAKPLYYREYAEALTQHGEDAETRDNLQVVLRFDPQNLDLKLALAQSLTRLRQTGEALGLYQEILDLAEKSSAGSPMAPRPIAAPSRSKRVIAWQSREEHVLAEIRRRFAVTRRTSDPLTKALAGLATFYHEHEQYNLAVPLWEKALQRTPDDDVAAFGLAKSYDAVGAWVSAVDFYKKAIELNKGRLEYRLTLANRYFENDMTFQAISLWRDVLAVRPALVDARLKLAEAFVRLEQYPDALREYERVLQIDPHNTVARVKSMQLRGRPVAGS